MAEETAAGSVTLETGETGGADEDLAESRNRLLVTAERFWPWLFLFALLIIFSVSGRGFFDLFNFQSILANASIGLIMALGLTFVIIAGGIDLSVAYVMGLSSVASAMVMSRLGGEVPLFVVVVAGLLAGLIAGLVSGIVNGVLVARFRVPPFIGTLGTYGVSQGAAFLLSGGQPVSVQINGLGQIGNGSLFYYQPSVGFTFLSQPAGLSSADLRKVVAILPHPLTLMIVMIVVCWWLLAKTRFGQHTYAIGGNVEAALRAGVPVQRHGRFARLGVQRVRDTEAGPLEVFAHHLREAGVVFDDEQLLHGQMVRAPHVHQWRSRALVAAVKLGKWLR